MATNNEVLSSFGIDDGDIEDQRGLRSVPFEPHLTLPEQVRSDEVIHLSVSSSPKIGR